MEDANILDLYFARKEDAIKETDAAYGRRLYVLANNIVQIHEDAEESVSDTYWKAWESIPPQRPQYFFAYLAKICRNFALGKLDWKNAAKRKAEIVTLSQEMEQCIPDKGHTLDPQSKEPEQASEPIPGGAVTREPDDLHAPVLVHGYRG